MQTTDVPPYQRHSETSRAAAESKKDAAPTEKARVLAFLRERGPQGATDEEMQLHLRMPSSTQRPRRVELVKRGDVASEGCTRRTVSGRKATVWVAVPIKALP